MKIVPAESDEQVTLVRQLFREYAAGLEVDLCFQNFEAELAGLPGDYASPSGRLFLAYHDEDVAGCVAMRKIDDTICEMKRLYIRPRYHGKGSGRILATAIIDAARQIGYYRIRLDTLPSMIAAQALYAKLGFREIGPYRNNPVPGSKFLELNLKTENTGIGTKDS
ncbi:MAG: GNAT family N-acetyltransferase [Acidobacteria bacterium]|nr:GNAT family N-acetyltransferase [Acidobacteriota bacterium]